MYNTNNVASRIVKPLIQNISNTNIEPPFNPNSFRLSTENARDKPQCLQFNQDFIIFRVPRAQNGARFSNTLLKAHNINRNWSEHFRAGWSLAIRHETENEWIRNISDSTRPREVDAKRSVRVCALFDVYWISMKMVRPRRFWQDESTQWILTDRSVLANALCRVAFSVGVVQKTHLQTDSLRLPPNKVVHVTKN